MMLRAKSTLPLTILLLALAALLSGCNASPAVSADGGAAGPFATSASAPGQGLPVTGLGLELAGCDPKGTFLNFRLSGQLSADESSRIEVDFDGRTARCHHPLGDPSILSCTIPPLTMFPSIVVIQIDQAVIAQFSYDGASCPAALFRVQPSPTQAAASIPLTGATSAGLATVRPTTKPPATSWFLWPTLSSPPTMAGISTATAQPATATEPPPPTAQPTVPAGSTSTEPPPSEPPPTQPPTQPPATSGPKPTPTDKPSQTPKPPPTQKPSPTPKPTHPPGPPTDPPTQAPTQAPTQPPTEPPPTPSG